MTTVPIADRITSPALLRAAEALDWACMACGGPRGDHPTPALIEGWAGVLCASCAASVATASPYTAGRA